MFRFKQNAEEEKSSLFHVARELKNKKSSIDCMKINGKISDNVNEIEEEVTTFFGALLNGYHDTNLRNTGSTFRPDFSHLDDILQDLCSLNSHEADSLEEDLDIDEQDIVIKNCPNNKAPGLDGLSYEFYKETWPIIRKTILMILQCQLDREKIIDSNRCGVPTVQDLRPLTLLNCDYRILAKLLVKRFQTLNLLVIRAI